VRDAFLPSTAAGSRPCGVFQPPGRWRKSAANDRTRLDPFGANSATRPPLRGWRAPPGGPCGHALAGAPATFSSGKTEIVVGIELRRGLAPAAAAGRGRNARVIRARGSRERRNRRRRRQPVDFAGNRQGKCLQFLGKSLEKFGISLEKLGILLEKRGKIWPSSATPVRPLVRLPERRLLDLARGGARRRIDESSAAGADGADPRGSTGGFASPAASVALPS